MLRLLRLTFLFLTMVVLVTSLDSPLDPTQVEIEPTLNGANDLDADATSWGYARPWRYGWRGGWKGWRGDWGWGGRVWTGRGGWW